MNRLETARATLTGPGKWTKDQFHTPKGVRHCLIGAMFGQLAGTGYDTDATPEVSILVEVITDQYPERTWGRNTGAIIMFNDHRDTKFADVDRVLDKAVVKSQELI